MAILLKYAENNTMEEGDKKSSFDKLVAGLDAEARQAMLNSINQSVNQSVQLDGVITDSVDKSETLTVKLQNETLFYKFFLWLRSLFARNTAEQLYCEDLLSGYAKKINKAHPGTVNHRIKVLDYIFYERLSNLKSAADFFKPYFSFIEENPGDFYVFLSSFVAPELADKVNTTADPFIIPFSRELSSDIRTDLTKKLDNLLQNMEHNTKTNIYSAVASANWLNKFVSLPFLHFLAQFTNVMGENYSCPYKNAIQDFNQFAAVFSHVFPVQNEVLEALFLFSQRKNLSTNVQEKDIEKSVKEFIAKANSHFGAIQSFIEGVPVIKLGKVVNGSFDWQPGNIEGAEGWFPLFRNQWKKIIDIRWNDWLREQKKQTLSENLKIDFDLDSFPVMEYRPWMKLWNRVPFSCELTGGFLSWFATEQYNQIILPLNTVSMEGIFYRSENRTEYSEGLENFSKANTDMQELVKKLSPEGEYGKLFEDFASNKVHTMQIQKQIEAMMDYTETTIKESIKFFGKGARTIERVFHGFFDEDKDGIHEGLQNMNTISGHDNRAFRESIIDIRSLLVKCMFYISELEPIDSVAK